MTDPEVRLEALKVEYVELSPTLASVAESLAAYLTRQIERAKLSPVMPVETRIKRWDSIARKLRRGRRDVWSLAEMDDLVGLRVVLLYRQEVQRTIRLVERRLPLLKWEDTEGRAGPDNFGYSSYHVVTRLPLAVQRTLDAREAGALKAEIQIRTLAQHLWASASHDLQYKREAQVPLDVRRGLSRVSAQLEGVDLELARLRDERER